MFSSPVKIDLAPVNLFFLYFPTEINGFNFNHRYKIRWPPRHLDRAYGWFSFLYKMLEKCMWKDFLEKLHYEILQFIRKIKCLSELFYKIGFLKIFQNSQEKPVLESLFDKVLSPMTWMHAKLKRASSTSLFLWILGKFSRELSCRTPPSNYFWHEVVFFSFLQISEVCSLKRIYLPVQWWITKRKSQAWSILRSNGNRAETSLTH